MKIGYAEFPLLNKTRICSMMLFRRLAARIFIPTMHSGPRLSDRPLPRSWNMSGKRTASSCGGRTASAGPCGMMEKPMSIYSKSTTQLLTEYINENYKMGETINKEEIVEWFSKNYPKIKSNTVGCHIIKFTTNHRTRVHYGATPKNDLLFQLADKRLRLYNPNSDPKPIYKKDEIINEDTETQREIEDSSQFAYESHLRDYLVNNLNQIEPALQLFRDEEDNTITGVEFDAGGKRIDILALDSNENFVVIELKVSRGYERTVGQLLRYRAWVRENLADGKKVRGVIIAKSISPDLRLATREVEDIDVFEYDLKIDLKKV